MWAAYYGYAHHIRKLRSVGALFDLQDENGLTALHWSTQAAHITADSQAVDRYFRLRQI